MAPTSTTWALRKTTPSTAANVGWTRLIMEGRKELSRPSCYSFILDPRWQRKYTGILRSLVVWLLRLWLGLLCLFLRTCEKHVVIISPLIKLTRQISPPRAPVVWYGTQKGHLRIKIVNKSRYPNSVALRTHNARKAPAWSAILILVCRPTANTVIPEASTTRHQGLHCIWWQFKVSHCEVLFKYTEIRSSLISYSIHRLKRLGITQRIPSHIKN